MNAISLTERLLWYLQTGLSAILIWRFFHLKLARPYRFFVAYLVLQTLRFFVVLALNANRALYGTIWKITEPMVWVLYILLVLEVCFLVFKEYRGIYTLGRWAIFGSLIVAVFLSVFTLLRTGISANDSWVQPYLMVERGIDFALVILLLLIVAFLVLLPIPLSRNATIHSVLYAIYFLSNSLGILIVNLKGYGMRGTMSASLMGVSTLCLVGWLVLLDREGESQIMVLRKQWTSSDEERLVGQLAAINATLLRAPRNLNP
jgi:hypothetical protein